MSRRLPRAMARLLITGALIATTLPVAAQSVLIRGATVHTAGARGRTASGASPRTSRSHLFTQVTPLTAGPVTLRSGALSAVALARPGRSPLRSAFHPSRSTRRRWGDNGVPSRPG